MERLDGLFVFLTGRRTAWVSLLLAVLCTGAVLALLPGQRDTGYPQDGPPPQTQSARVRALLEDMPSTDATTAIVVYSRDGSPLTDADRAAIAANAGRLATESTAPPAVVPRYDQDATAAIVVVPLDAEEAQADVSRTADSVRDIAGAGLPDGLAMSLTGPVGFQSDITNAFAGADTRLLLVTASVVALLLIVTYRSPLLWLVPLSVVAIGDGVARQVATSIGAALDTPIGPSATGILSVLVFGAGTNYALLIVARYREELLLTEDHHEAMHRALRSTYPAVLASGSTVAVSLLTLLLASLGSDRTLGWACAVGVVVAMGAALLILPAALVVCGRGLFWPFVPRYSPGATHHTGFWERLGRAVARRPRRTVAVAAVGLGVLATGLTGLRVGLPQTSQFVGRPESVVGQEVVADAFGPGLTSQTLVVVPDAGVADATATIEDVEGVSSVRPTQSADGTTVLGVTLDAAPQSDAAFDTVERLRTDLADEPGPASAALVGGTDATALDTLRAAEHDQRVVIPVICLVVLTILVLLLRSLVAPLLLMATVVATFAAAMGAGTLVFTHLLGYPGLDTSVPLFSFLFLVALGVDYNIFLTTRAREERVAHGTREGMVRALSATGGVITSAGILLAAVFAVLGVLPVVALMQIGVIVCIGVLLDTLVVRTLVVPALAFWLGNRFWSPSRRPVSAPDPTAPGPR